MPYDVTPLVERAKQLWDVGDAFSQQFAALLMYIVNWVCSLSAGCTFTINQPF